MSKSMKFQPMPMAALIADLKTLPITLDRMDSSDFSDDSSRSSSVSGSGAKVPVVESRSAVKSVEDREVERTPQVELRSANSAYKFPGVDVLPTIEASISQPVTMEILLNAQKQAPVVEKKESARCLFPEPTKEQPPSKAPPTPRETPQFRSIICPPPSNEPLELTQPTQPTQQTPATQRSQPQPAQTPVVATPSASLLTVPATQSAGPKIANKIHFKTIHIRERKYMFMKKLGVGGSSEVFKVLEISTSTEFAVKCVDLAIDREVAQGYLNEVKLLKNLQKSDRVIKLYDYEYNRNKNYLRLLMEPGETDLAKVLRAHREGVPNALVLHYWEEMLRAVQQIHNHGIVHADLKPANFLLVSGQLKLIDFGIASAVSSDATSVVRSCGKGTFSYISPEALGGQGTQPFKVSFYSDVWSLGCILYSLVYGRTPFAHLAPVAKLATIRDPAHCIAYPPTDKSLPPSLMTALRSCLRYDAHSRPTVTQLLQMDHLQDTTTPLPDSLLDKLRHCVTPEEFAMLQRARVYEE